MSDITPMPFPLGGAIPQGFDIPGDERFKRLHHLETLLSSYQPITMSVETQHGPKQVLVMGLVTGDGVGGGHPWKATAAGGANVAVAPGCVVGYRPKAEDNEDEPMRFPLMGEHIKFPGGSIPITAPSGTIYVHVSVATPTVEAQASHTSWQYDAETYWVHRSILYQPETLELVFLEEDASFEDGDIYIPIAEVSLVEGIAGVEYQILTHNPHIQLDGHSIDNDVN